MTPNGRGGLLRAFPRRGLGILCLVALGLARSARGQDMVTVRAGSHYAAGGFGRALFGAEYRDAWTAPITVPVLRPDTFAGGLTLVERGGGMQTRSLVFRTEDGREFVFRSVDKDQGGGLPPDLKGTLISDLEQDDVSSKHPGGALVVPPLLDAVGVLHATPVLVVMADAPSLGKQRAEFANMLGIIEERATDGHTIGGHGPYENVIGTDKLVERIEKSPDDRVDARAYLTARLMDLLVCDWDRHADQWRWAQVNSGGRRIWEPIPRDRDNAFSTAGGFTGLLSRMIGFGGVRFEPQYTEFDALTGNARRMDLEFLAELPRSVWDSVARTIRERVTDSVITEGIDRLPVAWRTITGPMLEKNLRMRRDSIGVAATRLYLRLAVAAEVDATDRADCADVHSLAGGTLRVELRACASDGQLYFDRTFVPQETRELRIYLRGGHDRLTVADTTTPIAVRVVGGGGDDSLIDASGPGLSAPVAFYDDKGKGVIVPGRRTIVDRRAYKYSMVKKLGQNNPPPPRDFGSRFDAVSLGAAWPVELGPVVSAGPRFTNYGFRRLPFASSFGLTASYAPAHDRGAIEVDAQFRQTGGDALTRFYAGASQLALARFYGFGNDSREGANPDLERIWSDRYSAGAEITAWISRRFRVATGPEASYFTPQVKSGSPADSIRPTGSSAFGVGGFTVTADYDGRDSVHYPRRGVRVIARAAGFPVLWGNAHDGFWRSTLSVAGYLPLPLPLETTLALRVTGDHVWDEAPVQFASFVGGPDDLRGYQYERFAGNSAAFANAELRNRLGRVNLGLIKGNLGTIALLDVGRVFVENDHSSTWHRGVGGGLWFGVFDRSALASIVFAHGEDNIVYLRMGMMF